jgi:putative hydrolase of the HAD superfamily
MNAVIFDFGGTLDTGGIHWYEKFLTIYSDLGIKIDRNIFREAFGYAERQMAFHDNRELHFTECYARKISFQIQYMKEQGLLPYIDEVDRVSFSIAQNCRFEVDRHIDKYRHFLSELVQKYGLAIVSNYYGNLKLICEEFDIDRYFKIIVDSTLCGVRKPDPQIFQTALDELHIKPEEAVVIGDSYDKDIYPPHTLGCKTVWLKVKSWNDSGNASSADYVIGNLKELKTILLPEIYS